MSLSLTLHYRAQKNTALLLSSNGFTKQTLAGLATITVQ
jgi:hypothetical protein